MLTHPGRQVKRIGFLIIMHTHHSIALLSTNHILVKSLTSYIEWVNHHSTTQYSLSTYKTTENIVNTFNESIIILDRSIIIDLTQLPPNQCVITIDSSLSKTENKTSVDTIFSAPTSLKTLFAHIQNHIKLQRSSAHSLSPHLQLNRATLTLKHNKSNLTCQLTEKETDLLYTLHMKGNMDRQTLLKAVWGYSETIDTHTLDTHVYRLRQKLEDIDGLSIIIENGQYRLDF